MNASLLAVFLGSGALAVSLVALTKTRTPPFLFDENLVPTQANSFTVGSLAAGVKGMWVGADPDLLTLDSISDRLVVGTSSYSTFEDLSSYTTAQDIADQSFTSQQYIANQSFSTAYYSFNPSYGGFYSTENQYMGQVTVNANIQSKSSLFYNYATAKSDDVICSVTKPSTGGSSVSGDSRIFLMTSGVYKISTSIQFDQTANSVTPVAAWLAVNGVTVPETGSIITIQQNSGESVPFVEFIIQMSSTQYFEIKWNSLNTTTWAARFTSNDGVGSTSDANIPSVITNVYRIA